MAYLEKEPESALRIRFPDCDPFNHLNNSKYIDYIINAREDQLLTYYDFDVHKLAAEKGIGWVMAQTQLSYIYPAFLNEVVTIKTRLLSVSEKSLLLEALMWNQDKSILKAVMWAKLVHYNLQERRSDKHASNLMQLFRQIVLPLAAPMIFEKRVTQLKSSLKSFA